MRSFLSLTAMMAMTIALLSGCATTASEKAVREAVQRSNAVPDFKQVISTVTGRVVEYEATPAIYNGDGENSQRFTDSEMTAARLMAQSRLAERISTTIRRVVERSEESMTPQGSAAIRRVTIEKIKVIAFGHLSGFEVFTFDYQPHFLVIAAGLTDGNYAKSAAQTLKAVEQEAGLGERNNADSRLMHENLMQELGADFDEHFRKGDRR